MSVGPISQSTLLTAAGMTDGLCSTASHEGYAVSASIQPARALESTPTACHGMGKSSIL